MSREVISFRHAALLLACSCFPALAQVPPQEAGSIRRETETLRPPPEPPRQESVPLPQPSPADAAAVKETGETLLVRAFRIEHPEPLTAAEVEAALASYTGRALSMAEIDAAARAVAALYHAHGYYLARASVPPQDARDGTLRVEVTIGRYGAVRLHNKAAVRDGLVGAIFGEVAEGEPARREALERALLLTSDLPGLALPKVSARPGQQAGTMDMDVSIDPGQPVGGFVVYDNQGSRFTGRHRLGAGLDWNSPLGLGDKLSLTGVYGRGDARHSGVGRLAYSLPLAPEWRVETVIERSDYALGDQYEALDATGKTDTAELGARYTVLRGQDRNLELNARVTSRRLRDEIGAFDETTKKRVTNGTLGARFEQWGQVFGRAAHAVAQLEYTHGKLHYTDAAQREANRLGVRSEGNFEKLELRGALDYSLARALNLNVELTVQQALGRSLGGSEQLSITGANGVRAYRESISADSAYVVHVEARYTLPSTAGVAHSVGLFADYGRGWYKRPRYVIENGVTAADVGLGYYAMRAPFFLRAQLAHKVGKRPDERLAKHDGDTHLLVQIGASF
jgi:hemolysin activation/secretion protein